MRELAARLNPNHQTMVREKIRASQLINALQNHCIGKKKMAASQVSAGLGLLKKCIPDLTNVELSGDKDNPLTVQIVHYADSPNPK